MVTRGQLDTLSRKLSELRETTALLSLDLAIKKFDPNQLRWSGGNSWGGRWRADNDESTPPDSPPQLVAITRMGTYDEARMPGCSAQLELDHEICRAAQSKNCWRLADIRFNNCMMNVYIPPLEVGK
jgi:hypothetical protein